MAFTATAAMADWTISGITFKGSRPSKMLNAHQGVTIYYNGTLKVERYSGGVTYYSGTGDICVLYSRNYTGPKLDFSSTGGTVQIKYLK